MAKTRSRTSSVTSVVSSVSVVEETNGSDLTNPPPAVQVEPIPTKPSTSKSSSATPTLQNQSRKTTKRKSNSSTKKNKNGNILAYFKGPLSSTASSSPSPPKKERKKKKKRKVDVDLEDGDKEAKNKEQKKRELDPKTREFLESGVPDVVMRLQKRNELEKEKVSQKEEIEITEITEVEEEEVVDLSQSPPPSPTKLTIRRSSRKKTVKTTRYRSASSSSESCTSLPKKKDRKQKKTEKQVLDPKTRAFLDSGVPEVVIWAQKSVEKKEEVLSTALSQSPPQSPTVRRSCRKKPGKITKYFMDRSTSSSSEPCSPLPKKKNRKQENIEKNKKVLDPKTRAFLDSGVPEVVIRAQKVVERKKEATTPSEEPPQSTLRRSCRKKSEKITKYFRDEFTSSSSSESCPPSPKRKERKEEKKVLDPRTRAFLDSGVPDVVIRAQKVVEKKKEEDDYLSSVAFFPKIQQVGLDPEIQPDEDNLAMSTRKIPQEFVLIRDELEKDFKIEELSRFSHFLKVDPKDGTHSLADTDVRHEICCKSSLNFELQSSSIGDTKNKLQTDPTPWIEKYKVEGLKELVCDKDALSKLTMWLKQWRSDIKDDGGTSRKQERKRKRRGSSESDFIESDDHEEEIKKKSLLLAGPPGCGKTAAVYVTAQHYGFQVIEVNFSSSRSGKEVLQNVEEAVLSHRLKSSHNCLLLFEDIDLIDPKEDEGFHSAVAQLITTAVRPIVMTTSNLGHLSLHSKLEKRDSFTIQFEYPKSTNIVRKILLPIIQTAQNQSESGPKNGNGNIELQLESNKSRSRPLFKILDSICRHGRSDIRQVINQSQFLFTSAPTSKILGVCASGFNFLNLNSTTIHQHGVQDDGILDLQLVRPLLNSSEDLDTSSLLDGDEDSICLSVKARKLRGFEKLDQLAEMLNGLGDLDFVENLHIRQQDRWNLDEELPLQIKNLKSSYFDPALCSKFSTCKAKGVDSSLLQSLIVDSDSEAENLVKGYKLFNEIAGYCDLSIYGDGGWECTSLVRNVVKTNMLDSVGRLAKRNGRVTSYFNRLDRRLKDGICESFGFNKELEIAKELVSYLD